MASLSGATTIFDQITGGGLDSSGDIWVSQTSAQAANQPYDAISVDDFATTSAYKLTSLTMNIGFWAGVTNSISDISSYSVEIYKYNAGAPTASLTGDVADLSVSTAHASASTAGTWGYSLGYQVTLDLSSLNYTLGAGQYWIGVVMHNNTTSGIEEIGVMSSTVTDPSGIANNALIINPGLGFGSGSEFATANPSNLALQLSGVSPAPEPVSMAFLGLGVVGLIARRRNRA